MIRLIQGRDRRNFPREIDEMFRLRAQVFRDRMGWDVVVKDGWEIDRFDELDPSGRFAYEGVRLGQTKHPDEPHPTRLKSTAAVTFEPNYETDSSKMALRQLGKAGFRLAALLTAVFESP